jgi:hypothetical protein
MGTQVLTDSKLYLGQYDVSGDLQAINSDFAAELLDVTTFGQTTRVRKGGLKVVTMNSEGLWSGGANAVDDALFAQIGVANVPVTIIPAGATLSNPAYIFRAIHGSYAPGATVGEMFRFSVAAEGSGGVGMLRGSALHVGTETATGTETGEQLGAVSATQSIYAALHVYSVSGTDPTLDVVLQSDDNSGFTTATGRITFAQATGITSEWSSLAGAVTDDYWRASFTIGGTDTPTFGFVLAVAIK